MRHPKRVTHLSSVKAMNKNNQDYQRARRRSPALRHRPMSGDTAVGERLKRNILILDFGGISRCRHRMVSATAGHWTIGPLT